MTDSSLISALCDIRKRLTNMDCDWEEDPIPSYSLGWDEGYNECLKEMDKIIDELEQTSYNTCTPIVPDETMDEILKNGKESIEYLKNKVEIGSLTNNIRTEKSKNQPEEKL